MRRARPHLRSRQTSSSTLPSSPATNVNQDTPQPAPPYGAAVPSPLPAPSHEQSAPDTNDEDSHTSLPSTGRPSTSSPSRRRGFPQRSASPDTTAVATRDQTEVVESLERRRAYMRCSPPSPTRATSSLDTFPYRSSPLLSGHRRVSHNGSATTAALSSASTLVRSNSGQSLATGSCTLSPIRGRTSHEAMAGCQAGRGGRLSSASNASSRAALAATASAGGVIVPDPVEFSAEAYSALHRRQFASTSEELDFLRRDFVASRRTLAVLHDETVRLSAALQDKASEVDELQEKLEWCRRQLDRLRGKGTGSSCNAVDEERVVYVTRPRSRRSSLATDVSDCATSGEAVTGDVGSNNRHNHEGDDVGETESGGRSRSGGGSSTALWLYAATGAARDRHYRNARNRSDSAANEGATAKLITELRRNLAKRDTALDNTRMEVGELKKARDALERELRHARLEASQSMQEQHRTLSMLHDKVAALNELEEKLKSAREADAVKDEELARLRTKCEVAELLGNYPAVKGVDGGLSQHEVLLDQIKTYRERWQAAEDRVDQLQQQLLACGGGGSMATNASPSATGGSVFDTKATIMPLPADGAASPSAAGGGASSLVLAEGERLRMEDEIRTQLETIRRLQRKLEREQESSAFREDQTRQQRQADLRQHAMEVSALRDQLEAARGQIAAEARDRESLVRQLRQVTHTESMANTLQAQNQSLRQRLAEVNAELAQAHGQRRELEVSVERETSERVRLAHAEDSLRAQVEQLTQREKVLAETVEELRERLGAAAARTYATSKRQAFGDDAHDGNGRHPSHDDYKGDDRRASGQARVTSSSVPTRGDGAAIASERKGYTALVDLNAALQQRLAACEEELSRRRTASTKEERGKRCRAGHPSPTCATCSTSSHEEHIEKDDETGSENRSKYDIDSVAMQREHLSVEVTTLREELKRCRRAQASLVASWQHLLDEHERVVADNLLLASGTEKLWDEVVGLRTAQARWKASPRTARSCLRTRLQTARSLAAASPLQQQQEGPCTVRPTTSMGDAALTASGGNIVRGRLWEAQGFAEGAARAQSSLSAGRRTAFSHKREDGTGNASPVASTRELVITVTHGTGVSDVHTDTK